MTELKLRDLTKDFGGRVAVDRLSLTVPDGALVALLGPSGCGKTTTLRMIAGLEAPSTGAILFDGRDMAGVPPERRDIGMVFQHYVLFPHMSVERNVDFGLRMRKLDKAVIRARTDRILETVRLTAERRRFPSQLSGGQQQRVAIARTLVTDPRLLLMDEPLSSLDAGLRGEMRGFIRDLQRRLGITTLFVTHDQTEAMGLADWIGVMFDGALAQFDTPANVFQHPATPRVATFLGAANLFEGVVADVQADRFSVSTALGRLRVAGPSPHRAGARATVTIRPEHCVLDAAPPSPAPTASNVVNAVQGRIAAAVYSGGRYTYDIAAGPSTLKVEEPSRRRLPEGSAVTVVLPAEHLWVFPEAATSVERDAARGDRCDQAA